MVFRKEQGQATVELAILIPVLAVFLLLIIQVALVVRQHVLVVNASRNVARELSVNDDRNRAIAIARSSAPNSKVSISRPSKPGEYLSVKVSDRVESSLPLIGVIFPDVTVSNETVMRVEK